MNSEGSKFGTTKGYFDDITNIINKIISSGSTQDHNQLVEILKKVVQIRMELSLDLGIKV